MSSPKDTNKIILIDFDDEDAQLLFKEEEPDLSDYVFHHTAVEPNGEEIDVYYLRENYDDIVKTLAEKYNHPL